MAANDPIADRDAPSGANLSEPEFCVDVPRLLRHFEGLGDGCDFGMVQRAVGIEPFGLFRFAGCHAVDLGKLLRSNLQHFGEPDDLWLEEIPPKREYRVKSYECPSFSSHTRRFGGHDAPEAVRATQIEMIRFLKRKLLRDLSLGQRLYVFKGYGGLKTIRELLARLQSYGDNSLLWVRLAHDQHLSGTVQRLCQGLYGGFVSRSGIYEPYRTPRVPIEDWVNVCARAYSLWRNADLPKVRLKNLLSEKVAAQSYRVPANSNAALRLLDEAAPSGGAVIEHRLGKTELATVCSVVVPIATGGNFSLSLWIRVPAGFSGRRIIAGLPGCSILSNWNADTLSQGYWQRLWVSASLLPGVRRISCELMADGAVGEVFHSASWCLEQRNLPSGYGFHL